MFKKLFVVVSLIVASFAAGFTNLKYDNFDLDKFSYSFLTIAILYFIFKILLEEAVAKRIENFKTRYSFRKTTQVLFLVVSSVVILRIWIINPQALLVAYGLIAAGIAISLQDVFKNFAGAFAIFITGIYKVGDRVEINGKFGDIIDISLFYTTLLEIRGWVAGDQATGRLTVIPNGAVLGSAVNNYTKDHSFIWDEINIPITYQSDWKEAIKIVTEIVKNNSKSATSKAEKEIQHLEERYYLSKRNIEPSVFVTLTDNWIMLHTRYITSVRERRTTQSQLSINILEAFEAKNNIHIASTSLTITSDSDQTL